MQRRDVLRSLLGASVPLAAGCRSDDSGEAGGTTAEPVDPRRDHSSSTTTSLTGALREPSDATETGSDSGRSPTATRSPVPCDEIGLTADDEQDRFEAAVRISGNRSDAAVTASVVQGRTERSPAEADVVFRNRRPERTVYQFGTSPPFSGLQLSHESLGYPLVLAPDSFRGETGVIDHNEDGDTQVVPDEPADGCWTAEDIPHTVDYFAAVELDPCESFRRTFQLLSHPSNEGCLPAGRYDRTDDVTNRTRGTDFELTFAVTVSN